MKTATEAEKGVQWLGKERRLPAWPMAAYEQRVAPAFGFYDDGRCCPLPMQKAAVKYWEAALEEARSREHRLLQGIRGIGDEPEIA